MLWRTLVLAALGIGFGIAAGLCIATQARLYAAVTAFYTETGDSGPTAAQSASAAEMNAQLSALYQFAGPLVAGALLCVVALLVVLAWRWQTRRVTEQR